MSFRAFPFWLLAFFLLILAQVVWRNDVLVQRPYWSSAQGVFTHASALAFQDADSSATPAPAAYRSSVVPVILSTLMKSVPAGTSVILSFRVLGFAMAAVALLMVVAHLQPRTGWTIAILSALATYTTPVFAVQAENMTERISAIALILASTLCFLSRRFLLAAIFALAAFFCHWIAVLLIAVGLLLLFVRRSLVGIASFLTALGIAGGMIAYRTVPALPFGGWVPGEEFGTSPLLDVAAWIPDVPILVGAALITAALFYRPARVLREPDSSQLSLDGPGGVHLAWVTAAVALFAITGLTPGDTAFLIPSLFIVFAWAMASYQWTRVAAQAILYAAVAVNLVNSTGTLYPKFTDPVDFRTGSLRERSREYLADDHAFNVLAVRAILNREPDRRFLAPPPFAHFLALPALGYVQTPLEGYSLGKPVTERFADIETIRDDDYHPLAIIHVKNRSIPRNGVLVPTPERSDQPIFPREEEIFRDPRFTPSPLFVFGFRETPSDSPAEAKRRYLRRIWPEEALFSEALQLLTVGNLRGAEPLLRKLLEAVPRHHAARLQLANLLEQQGAFDQAIAEYRKIPLGSAEFAPSQSQIAQILTGQRKFDEADQHHATAIAELAKRPANNPVDLAHMLVRWATNDLGRSNLLQARTKLRQAIDLVPNDPIAHRELGFVLFKERRFKDAQASLAQAEKLDPTDPITFRYLGAVYGSMEDYDRAASAFRQALLLAPTDGESLDGLTTVLLKTSNYDEAIREIEDALALRPGEAEQVPFLLGLAEALKSKGEWQRALATLRRAKEIAPDSKDAANQLAWTLATSPAPDIRNGTEAREIAQILGDGADSSIYTDTLAAVEAELGRWDEAVSKQKQAIERAKNENRPDRVKEFSARLLLYEQKQPFRTGEPVSPAGPSP